MRFIKRVKHLKEYELSLSFGDGSVAVVNLRPYLRGKIFRPLKKIPYFKKVRVNRDIDTIFWPNGADFAPEFLYAMGRRHKKH